MRRPREAAYHEAGHAVVGRSVGRTVRSIRVDRSLLGGGRTIFEPATDDIIWVVSTAAVALAGYLAQRRAYPGDRAYAAWGSENDLRALAQIARFNRLNLLLLGGRLANRLLTMQWAEVERVAAALRPGRTFAGSEIFPVQL